MADSKKQTAKSSPHSSDDSVDLADLLAANALRTPAWIDAVSRGPAAPPLLRSATAAHNSSSGAATSALTSSPGDATTPSPSRLLAAGEVTAMGSPIAVDADESDGHIHHLISQLARTEGGSGAGGSGQRGGPPSPPPPAPARAAPQATSPPAPHPLPKTSAPLPTARPAPPMTVAALASTQSRSGSSAGLYASPALGHASASQQLIDAVDVVQHYPFGDSYQQQQQHATLSGEESASLQYSEMPDTTTATETYAPPTSYSSALMQALSRSEGAAAAAASSQWGASPLRPSHTYSGDYDEDGQGSGGSDMPPDMYAEAMRAKVAKQQWMALEQARQAVLEEARRRRDCPFAPQVSPYAARMQRPSSLRPERRVQSEVMRRRQWLAKKQQQEAERELRECTFRPLTVRTAQLDPAALAPAGPAVFHQLYAEAEDRRTFEAEVKPRLVEEVAQRQQRSPMRAEELAEVVERLCSRGAVRTAGSLPNAQVELRAEEDVGGEDSKRLAAAAAAAESHQPALSEETQRIVAAKVAAGERHPDIVRHLYHQAERDAAREALKAELNTEKEKVARAEQAVAMAQERRRLQQDYLRSVLAAKYRALARHACEAQHTTYRATAPQPVAQLARAAFNLLSVEETEELLAVLERCGQHKLREAEFVTVVFQHCAQQHTAPTQSALLSRPPPPLTQAASRVASARRASSAPRSIGSGALDGSPVSLPKVKREKPDPEVIAQIRESRALALEEWKAEHQRKRAIADGEVADDDFTFQPAPRRLIPFECRPDVTVPVKLTRSEQLRRAYIASRQQDGPAAAATSAAAAGLSLSSLSPSLPIHYSAVVDAGPRGSAGASGATRPAATARELFARVATAEGRSSEPPQRPSSVPLRARSSSGGPPPSSSGGVGGGGARAFQRERSAAALTSSPAARQQAGHRPTASSRAASRSSPQPTKPAQHLPGERATYATLSASTYRASLPPSAPTPTPGGQQQPQKPQEDHRPSPSPEAAAASAAAARLRADVRACESRGSQRQESLSMPSTLVEQLMHSTPEERARLGRELLLRQLRDRQRRRST